MTNDELKERIIDYYKKHTAISKPKGGYIFIENIGNTKIDGVEKEGFQYSVDSKNKKYVPFDTLFLCYKRIFAFGELTTEWFKTTFPKEYKDRPCNFTTIGGVFILLGIAVYKNSGIYKKIDT